MSCVKNLLPYQMCPVPVLSTLDNLNFALDTWAKESTQDVLLYMVGRGSEGSFNIGDAEVLTAAMLNIWLDTLQENISGPVVVVYDACHSASFVPFLTHPDDKERIVICSTGDDQAASFASDGDFSFSNFFWRNVLNGTNVYEAFRRAENPIHFIDGQTPCIDDNRNGICNEKSDGQLAREYTIGMGILFPAKVPVIGDISGNGDADLGDAVLALKVLAGNNLTGSGYAASGIDVNGDNKISMEEVIFILQNLTLLK